MTSVNVHGGGLSRVAETVQRYSLVVDGSAVLAAAAGTLSVATTNAASDRRLPLVIETGLGTGLAVAGAVWRGAARRALVEGSRDIVPSPSLVEYASLLADQYPREVAASVMFGLGLGMAAAGGVSLVTRLALGRKPEPARQLEPIGGPMVLGLRGRF